MSSDETEFWSQYCEGLTPYGGRVEILSEPRLGKPLRIAIEYNGRSELNLDGSYMNIEYMNSIDLALEVCHTMGVPRESVVRSLETFRGVPGRGEILQGGGMTLVRERNPGISHISIRRTLECLERMGALDGALVILNPVSKKVCDKMNKDKITKVADAYGVPIVIIDDDGRRSKIPSNTKLLIEFVKEAYQ